jgi:hypothetical protein
MERVGVGFVRMLDRMTRPLQTVSLNVSNNWEEHRDLLRSVAWSTANGRERYIVFEAMVDGHQWFIRLNDFPEEPLYSLMVDGSEVIHFDEWPEIWGATPHFPKVPTDGPN